MRPHPKGTRARVLLSSVFKPFAQDDEFGSRAINPHETVFHQFMLYTPVPGTPLYREVEAEGRLLQGVDLADIHGQFKFNFRHAAISRDQSKAFLDRAFRRDFEANGPSLYRLIASMLTGWRRYRDDPDRRACECPCPLFGQACRVWRHRAMTRVIRARGVVSGGEFSLLRGILHRIERNSPVDGAARGSARAA